MIIDKELIFSDDQVITADAASTVVIDQEVAGGPFKKEMYLFVKSTAAFNTLTSMNIQLQTSSDNFSSDTTILSAVNVLLAGLTKDTVLIQAALPIGLKRYIRVYYDVVGTNPTLGSMYAALVDDVEATFDVS